MGFCMITLVQLLDLVSIAIMREKVSSTNCHSVYAPWTLTLCVVVPTQVQWGNAPEENLEFLTSRECFGGFLIILATPLVEVITTELLLTLIFNLS